MYVNVYMCSGAQTAGSPAEVAAQTDTIVTMLPANDHVREVYNGKDGIFRWDSPPGWEGPGSGQIASVITVIGAAICMLQWDLCGQLGVL